MIFTKEDKQLILRQYLDWVDQVSDELEDKTHFYPEEIVHKVLELVEKKISIDEKIRERQSWRDSVEGSGKVVFVAGKKVYLGVYTTEAEASEVYKEAKRNLLKGLVNKWQGSLDKSVCDALLKLTVKESH